MKSIRHAFAALVLSASVLSLAGCFGAKDATAPLGGGIDTSAPQAPTNVHVTSDVAAQRDWLHWSPSASLNVSSYQVFLYATDPGSGGQGAAVATLDATETTWALPIVNSNRVEFYRVRAVNGSGVASALSATVTANRTAWNDHGTAPDGNPGGQGSVGVN